MPIRVVIFEDNNLVRSAYSSIFSGTEGFVCAGCYSSCHDLDHNLQRSNPDVVLMDIQMPGMDGIEATRIIKQKYPMVKILMQTVFSDDDNIFNSLCAGASGYLLKSARPTDVIEAVVDVYNGGGPMSGEVAAKVIKLFQNFAPKRDLDNDETSTLTKREDEILKLMMEGHNFHVIAEMIFLSYDTVRTHVRNIYKKLHVNSANQAIVKGLKKSGHRRSS